MDFPAGNIKEDCASEDLLFQVILDMDVPLSSTIEVTDLHIVRRVPIVSPIVCTP